MNRLALVLSMALAACRAQPSRPQFDSPDRIVRLDGTSVPIQNFTQVDEGLYRGAQPDRAGFEALAELGVRTVINLREFHDDAPSDLPAGMRVVEIPMHALFDSDPPTEEDLRRFFEVVVDPARRPVFVHCARGKDRTGTMCAIYRIEVHGWSPEDAFAEMQKHGFHDMYRDLERFVLEYRPRGLANVPR